MRKKRSSRSIKTKKKKLMSCNIVNITQIQQINNGFKGCKWSKILLVDDLPFNIIALEAMIKDQFKIICDKWFSGKDAITKVKSKLNNECCKSYKLIIIDFYMPPGMNGSEATTEIKKLLSDHHKDSYIVWLTAQKEGDFNFTKSIKLFDEFYQKPLTVIDVNNLIKMWHIG